MADELRVWVESRGIWHFCTESIEVSVHGHIHHEPDELFCTTRPEIGLGLHRLKAKRGDEAQDEALDLVGEHLDKFAAELRTPSKPGKWLHVDDFIDDYRTPEYTRAFLLCLRLPAMQKIAFRHFMAGRRLFCTHAGERYRVVMASRMGDVGLSKNFDVEDGYSLRVPPTECTDWSADP